MENIKISLKACRVNAGFTVTEAAEKIGITRHTLHKWEVGKTSPTIEKAKKLCEIYKMDYNNVAF